MRVMHPANVPVEVVIDDNFTRLRTSQISKLIIDRTEVYNRVFPFKTSQIHIRNYPDLTQLCSVLSASSLVIEMDQCTMRPETGNCVFQSLIFKKDCIVDIAGLPHLQSITGKNMELQVADCPKLLDIIVKNHPRAMTITECQPTIRVIVNHIGDIITDSKIKLALRGEGHMTRVLPNIKDFSLYVSGDLSGFTADALNYPHLTILNRLNALVDMTRFDLSKVTTLVIEDLEPKLPEMPKLQSWKSPPLSNYGMLVCLKVRFIVIEMINGDLDDIEALVLASPHLYENGTAKPNLKFSVSRREEKREIDVAKIIEKIEQAPVKSARNV